MRRILIMSHGEPYPVNGLDDLSIPHQQYIPKGNGHEKRIVALLLLIIPLIIILPSPPSVAFQADIIQVCFSSRGGCTDIFASQETQISQKYYCSQIKSTLKNAYMAAQVYFHEHPDEPTISSVAPLRSIGFKESLKEIEVYIRDFSLEGGFIAATHPLCDREYRIDFKGEFTDSPKVTLSKPYYLIGYR